VVPLEGNLMTIVVTGATGHLGHLIVEALLHDGVAPSDIVAGGRNLAKLDDPAAGRPIGETSGELSRLIGRSTTPLAEGLAAALA
jgi:uncharacterized protein YbjT (DUF2867 family)